MKVTGTAFTDGGTIPEKYTCKTGDTSPPLHIDDIPEGTKTLALIADDPDAPSGTWVHWVVWNIPPASGIKAGTVPEGAVQGIASDGRNAYHSPCPPSGTHRYYYKVYALDTELDLPAESKKKDLEDAMSGHVLAKAEIMGQVSSV
ncbi:MAG: YbhB/YbcL family Raf kinase inhibitor-like protein [Candidatus Altiarchaeota archaeon]|nr:YbhB/YbcL family Raf kinase inhibitor-like protein [Candidatus Altiarchaeota archaeon]